jgi:hypothetical protein
VVPDPNKEALVSELMAARNRFRWIALGLSPRDLARPSRNPAWTNGALLFHMALGFFILPPLFVVIGVLSRMSPSVSQVFSAVLNGGTPMFNLVNMVGARVGGHVLQGRGLVFVVDVACRVLIRMMEALPTEHLYRGIAVPRRWDSTFDDVMSAASFVRYAARHCAAHAADLTVTPSPA